MSNVLKMNGARPRNRKLTATTVANAIDFSDGSGPARMVAYPERELPPGGIPAYLAARKSGVRSFVLWADEDRRERVATVVTESAAGGVATFHVLGAHGEHLGTIVREKAFRGRGLRARWTVTPVGRPRGGGLQGPDRVVVRVVAVSAPDGGHRHLLRPRRRPRQRGRCRARPRRIRWRAGGRMPLEFRSRGSKLHLHAPETDWRLGAALVALVRSFSADNWDGLKA